MNALRSDFTASPEVIGLDDLYLSPLNPRQSHDEASIALLADSLVTCGLMQNLGGYRDGEGRVGIVFGGRRLAALRIAVARRPDLAHVPVALAPDEETARLWAESENIAREALAPVDEIRAYGRMRDSGATVAQIAQAFGVTEAHVYRRVKLADLPPFVLDALAAGKIGLGIASAFTVSQDTELSQQVLARVLSSSWALSEHEVRKMLQPEAVGLTDRRVRFVGEEAYVAAGGHLTRDLFSDAVFFEDVGLLDRLFAEKLEAAAEAERSREGWAWARKVDQSYFGSEAMDDLLGRGFARVYPVPVDLSEEETEEYGQLADLDHEGELDEAGEARMAELDAKSQAYLPNQKAVAGVCLYVDHSGCIRQMDGLIRAEDVPAAVEAGVIEARSTSAQTEAPAAPKSPYSGALVEDMKAIRLAAVQTALLDCPEMVLNLLAFGLSTASGVGTSIFDLQPGCPMNAPKEREGLIFSDRLAHPPRSYEAWSRPDLRCDDLVAAFREFVEQGKKARNAAITEGIARTLPYAAAEPDFFAMIEADSGASIRKVWTPTAANFFGRVSGAYLDDLFVSLIEAEASDSRVKAFRDKKKKEKADAMERLFGEPEYQAALGVTADQKARIAAWVPDCF